MLVALLLGQGCAWDPHRKMVYDDCIEGWAAYEHGMVGLQAEVYPEGIDPIDYCLQRARQAHNPALLATGRSVARDTARAAVGE